MSHPNHQDSIAANKESFAHKGKVYDARDDIQTLTDFFAASLVTFDPSALRKTVDETETGLTAEEVHAQFAKLTPHNVESKLIRPNTKIIDFACGTGLVGEKIAPFIAHGQFTGVDISDTMLDIFDARAARLEKKWPGLEMRSMCGDVLDPKLDTDALKDWADILICTLAFHHIHSVEEVATVLKSFVRPGGYIFVYDFYNEDLDDAEQTNLGEVPEFLAKKGVARHGLSTAQLLRCFERGCADVSVAREAKVKLWVEDRFVRSHCRQSLIDQLDTLPQRDGLYYVDTSIVLGVARVTE